MNCSEINNKRVAIKCTNWLQSFKLLRLLKRNGFYWKSYSNIWLLTYWSKRTNCYNVVANRVMLNNDRFYKENDFNIIDFKDMIRGI